MKNNNKINQSEKNIKAIEIKLPCGAFCGSDNCTDCKYANWDDAKDGWIRCNNSNISKNYVNPGDRFGCWHYSFQKN